ncbi:MAG: zinc ribbon domain-containing protein [Thermoplasmata archaeon]|nr:MAG: zinc ribbon domain-containing protein [Thermoplasmata archaeon]
MFCSNCGADISDEANFCEKCGAKQDSKVPTEGDTPKMIDETLPEEVTVELVEKETQKIQCEMCSNAELENVSDEGKPPLYRCPACGFYYGNFLRKGNNIYYDTTHLRIGQYIASQLIHGKYRVSAHKNQREKGLDDMADKIRQDIKLDRTKITESLSYLIDKNVLYTYYEPTPDGEFEWFGIAFSDSIPEDTEITK